MGEFVVVLIEYFGDGFGEGGMGWIVRYYFIL